MELKKNPEANLENHHKLFFLLGIALALLVSYVLIEWKTFDRNIAELTTPDMSIDTEIDIPVTMHREEIKPPPPPPAPSKEILILDNDEDIIEDVIETSEVEEGQKIDINDIQTAETDEELDPDEEIPFVLVEEVPTFLECKGSNEEKKLCFQQKIRKLVGKYYDTGLANELGLSPGKKRVFVQFTIDKNGDVTDIQARGPHKRLEKEAIRVMRKLPKLIPGKQRNRAVGVKYTLPISLIVE